MVKWRKGNEISNNAIPTHGLVVGRGNTTREPRSLKRAQAHPFDHLCHHRVVKDKGSMTEPHGLQVAQQYIKLLIVHRSVSI